MAAQTTSDSQSRLRKALRSLDCEVTINKESNDSSAKCSPWSKSDFVIRLRTFQPTTWFAKPDIISPLQCARHGWINIGMDTIKCNICSEKLSFVYSGLDFEDTEDAAKNFSKYLDIGHSKNCSWRGMECPLSFMQFSKDKGNEGLRLDHLNRSQLVLEALHQPLQRIMHFEDGADQSSVVLMNAKNMSEYDKEFLKELKDALSTEGPIRIQYTTRSSSSSAASSSLSSAASSSSSSSNNNSSIDNQESAFLLTESSLSSKEGISAVVSMFGWTVQDGGGHNCLSCEFCGQKLPKKRNDTPANLLDGSLINGTIAENASKKMRTAEPLALESGWSIESIASLKMEHRWFCPWIRGNQDQLAGWQQCLKALVEPNSTRTSASMPSVTKGRNEIQSTMASAAAFLRHL